MLLSKGILTKYVWSNSNMQSLIMNIKSVLIAEITHAWKWHEVTNQFWTHTSWNWTTHHVAKF
jgi:hypothetical protein